MGFRNPVTTAIDPDARTAAADAAALAQLARTEIIPGTRIAADAIGANHISAGAITATKLSATAIDGKTISGATLLGALVRAQGSGDATATSTLHALQAGPTGGANLALDGNEAMARNNGVMQPFFLNDPRGKSLQVDQPSALTRKDYVDALAAIVQTDSTSGGWRTGWTNWGDGVYEDLQFTRTRDRMVTVSGLAKFTGAAGATTLIFALSGEYVPFTDDIHIINGSVNGTSRLLEVRPDGLYLRGTLPTTGQFISVNGIYPGANIAL